MCVFLGSGKKQKNLEESHVGRTCTKQQKESKDLWIAILPTSRFVKKNYIIFKNIFIVQKLMSNVSGARWLSG